MALEPWRCSCGHAEWRLESGEVAIIQRIATAEKESDRFVSRIICNDLKASYSSDVLELPLIWREVRSVTVNEFDEAARPPWAKQAERAFGGRSAILG